MSLHTYLPQDRLRAIANNTTLPDRTSGSALFADISGFTALTDKLTRELGARRGIEDVAQQINQVYDALIEEIEHLGGSVVIFSGDAITCWFDEELGNPAHRAILCAGAMQQTMKQFPDLSLKIAVCSGPIRRFAVGDPDIQLIDTLAGATLTRLAIAEGIANPFEILLDQETTQQLNLSDLPSRTAGTGDAFTVLNSIPIELQKSRITDSGVTPIPAIDAEKLKPWILPLIFEKETTGHELLLTELRPTAALFIRFTGIDYDKDPQAWEKLNTIVSRTQQALEKHEGTLLQLTIGDKGSYLYASFGATHIHENDAQRAIHAALKIQAALKENEYSEKLQIGLASGTMRVGGSGSRNRKTFAALGNGVNLAARLMMAAEPGEILISSRIQKSNRGEFIAEARPPMTVKGFPEPIMIFAVQGLLQQRSIRLREPSYQLPMIGREKELNLIAERLDLAVKGKGQIVGITGEAGLGKSRLVAEGIRLARRHKLVGYGGACQSDGTDVAYTVWNPIWNAVFDLDPAMPLRKQMRLIEGEFEDRIPDRIDALPVLGPVLGLSLAENDFTRPLQPADRKSQLEAILLELLESHAREAAEDGGGLLLVLEDLHWIDPLSFDLLLMMTRIIERLPVLILLTYRSAEMESQNPQMSLIRALEHYTHINLTELTAAESEQAIRAKLAQLFPEQTAKVSKSLIDRITLQAQGNPFYVEELLNYIRDRGLDPGNLYALKSLDLPTSLHSLILSRIDNLTVTQQQCLKAASIIGRVFQADHLYSYYPTLGTPREVQTDLTIMERQELTPQISPEPNLTFTFKHLVTHEVSYESMAFATRSKLHGQYAEFLEQTKQNQIEQFVPQLANHYEKAGLQDKARDYLIKAGEQAAANYANGDALSYFNRALKLTTDRASRVYFDILMKRERVSDLLGRRLEQRQDLETLETLAGNFEDELYLRSVVALRKAKLEIDEGNYGAAKKITQQAIRELSSEGQDLKTSQLHVDALLIEARSMFLAGQAIAAKPQLDNALTLAHTHQYIRGEYNALAQLGLWNWYNGDNKSAIELMEHSLELIRQAGDIRREADILNNLGIVAKDMYRFNDSLEYYAQAQKISRKIGDRSGESALLNNMGRVCINSGDLVQAISYCNQAAVLAAETNDTPTQGIALHNKSEAYRELGQYALSREAAEKSINLLSSSGYQVGEGWALENLALTEFFHGRHETALQLAEKALSISRTISARRLEVSVLTRIGLMRLGMAQLDLAQAAFRTAEKIEEEFKEAIPTFEIQAGLAGVELARQEPDASLRAASLIHPLTEDLLNETHSEQNQIPPMWLYLTCIRVLKACKDSRLETMIAVSHKELLARAEKVSDPSMRTGFLKIQENQFILAFASTLPK